jgi:hypothetical protein
MCFAAVLFRGEQGAKNMGLPRVAIRTEHFVRPRQSPKRSWINSDP